MQATVTIEEVVMLDMRIEAIMLDIWRRGVEAMVIMRQRERVAIVEAEVLVTLLEDLEVAGILQAEEQITVEAEVAVLKVTGVEKLLLMGHVVQ